MNEIHQLDTREQKSPQYLEKIPNLIHEKLEVGDYLSASKIKYLNYFIYNENQFISLPDSIRKKVKRGIKGHCVENKFDDFDIQSTDTVDQFHVELSQMCEWGKENPHVVLHAAWVKKGLWKNPYRTKLDGTVINVIEAFTSMCAEYDVWPHFYETGEDLLKFYKKLDQEKAYQKHGIFIKKDRTLITLRAKKFRQHPRISSEVAVKLDDILTRRGYLSSGSLFGDYDFAEMKRFVCDGVRKTIIDVIGKKKNGKPKKLAVDLIDHLENGPKQKKKEKPLVFDEIF